MGPSTAQPRRIALVSDYPPDHATFRGGVQTATAALLEGLQRHQSEFEFHVVSLSRSIRADTQEERDGFYFHFLSLPTAKWLPSRAPFRVGKLLAELRRIRPALVHCTTDSFAPLAVILGGFRRVLTIHGVSGHEAHLRTGRVIGSATVDVLLERYIHAHFPAFICISRYVAALVGKRAVIFAIPNPVGSTFLNGPYPAEQGGGPRLLYLGALSPLKRPADLLLAHAELRGQIPELQTTFCGHAENADYAHSLRRTIADRGIAGVKFVEYASREETAELLRGSSVVVLPSAQENAPMVIAEAMAVGVAVIATRVGGVPEMIQDGVTGLLYQVGDVPALTQHLSRLLADVSLRTQYGARARQQAQAKYAPAVVAQAIVAAYNSLLDT